MLICRFWSNELVEVSLQCKVDLEVDIVEVYSLHAVWVLGDLNGDRLVVLNFNCDY